MKQLFPIALGGLAVTIAQPVLAQEDRAPRTPSEAFSGTRIEALLGYDHVGATSTKDIDSTAAYKPSSDGVVFGGGIGYDFALTRRVTLGGEAELTGSSAKSTIDATDTFNLTRLRAGRDWYIGTRIGYAVSPSTLLYAKAGYTNARFNLTGANSTQVLTDRRDLDGYRLGAGVEQKITGLTFTKLEYRYSHYSNATSNYDGYTPDASTFGLNSNRHQIVASVGVRF
ncbi:outer membrane protein [Novosphingobium sp.]|uniref:outer membrane protein n=1 Tax=Novosphingobium sp. TaxID=1874826 RepID=UPI0038B8469E